MHGRMRCIVIALILSLSLADRGSAQEPKSAEKVHWAIGCYVVEMGAWTSEIEMGLDSVFLTPPGVLFLDTTSVEVPLAPPDLPPALRVVPLVPWAGAPYLAGSWRPITSYEGVSLNWTNGFSGFFVNAERRGEDLEGVAQSYWDFPREDQTAEIRLRRIPCGSVRDLSRELSGRRG
jgi:hypothetical protein